MKGRYRRSIHVPFETIAVGGDASLMARFTEHPRVERILGQGETKSSIRLRGGYQADLRLVPNMTAKDE